MGTLRFAPLTPELWPAFAELFGPRGACAGCWCMWWRLGQKPFDAGKGARNRARMRRLVAAGPPPGILALDGARAVGWCAVAPRADYPRLSGSRVLAPLDTQPVWSVTCFFVERAWRRQGVTVALLGAAVEHVRRQGGRIVEGYPVEPRKAEVAPVFVYTGLVSAFRRAGFREVERRSPTRPIMRRVLRDPRAGGAHRP